MAPLPAHITADLVARAASALRRGELVVLPTETLYGVFADVTVPAGAGALRQARVAAGTDPAEALTWHAGSPQVAIALCEGHPVHRAIVEKVTPGPVRLLFEVPDALAGRVLGSSQAGVFDASLAGAPGYRLVAVRVPSDPVFQAVASVVEREGGRLAGERAGLVGLGDGTQPPEGASLAGGMVIDAGRAELGRPSTVVRLTRSGWYRIESVGAISERALRASFERSVLFVCTGNTCRSPMAEAIARHYLAKPGATHRPTRVSSAGVATSDGLPMSEEAEEALRTLRIDPGRHRARRLTREMVDDATVIFAMTRAHARQALELVPSAHDKIVLLDPGGRDIPDPVGASLATYVETAERLAVLIRDRFTTDGTLTLPRKRGILEPG